MCQRFGHRNDFVEEADVVVSEVDEVDVALRFKRLDADAAMVLTVGALSQDEFVQAGNSKEIFDLRWKFEKILTYKGL